MTKTIDDIIENFSQLDDWEDRYRYVIELGYELPPFPESERNDTNKVHGCVSQVWLFSSRDNSENPVLTFQGDSDAHIVRGLIYILLAFYSGKKASEIRVANAEELLVKLGLNENLTPQRSNGLKAMIKRIRAESFL
ncbi:Cysteine desulfuration protein SufE [Bartonella sp. CDC_skunk]|uniref:Fe-S metabolism associated domain-containing protein n=1 Tax=Bartonella rochalimae ATCC BAA-1498 TaxID=685782 RepID=E6YKS5_9HYPH|nr:MULTISPECIES: SufE family protein [Bartonella]AQX18697.1 Cysteine desulfuration protein SufE [Bartonella sp. A1379B]AQX21701.1 Cysteine desulfuration protein SufE [Bartonella sp. CDC_skunk]AQX23209.1 cysteine desulfuration protein SufE [Bartonella sp. 11B]AQX23490.1 cysteine desulfuration protein SufE [Bartonella sp. 114]AQX25666.1 Cysteine desulfuration protein SufE [Bartonella sp. Coyote22sub2]